MPTCLLVRHAATNDGTARLSGRSSSSLSDAGRNHAVMLARRIPRTVDAVHSSPRPRCLETASPYASAVDRPIIVDEALDEIDFGRWAGRRFSELAEEPAWRLWNDQRSATCPPGGETMADAQGRILRYLADLRHTIEGTIVTVTHAELIRAAILHCQSLPLEAWNSVDVPLCSVTTFVITRGGGIVLQGQGCPVRELLHDRIESDGRRAVSEEGLL